MDHRRRAEVQNISPTTEGQPEGEAPKLEHTGERFLPGIMGSVEIAYDHITRYRFAERYVKGKKTIDLGCGVGYGTHSLSKFAESVLGVDLSEEAVAYASWSYEAPNLRYEVGDVTNLPYEDGSFEAAISFEVIEHLERPEELVEEARRLLKEDGVFVVSTPDKQTYSNDRNSVNPHHLKEMYTLEFREILERCFEHVQTYRQGALAGSIIASDMSELPEYGPLTLESTRFSLPEPAFGREVPTALYMVAVCTNGPAPEPLQAPYMVMDRDRQIYEEQFDGQFRLAQLLAHHGYEMERSRQIQKQLQERIQDLHELVQEQHAWGERLRERVLQLQLSTQEQQARAERLRERVQEQDGRVERLLLRIENMENSRGWRIAQRLNGFQAGIRRIFGRG